MELVKLRFHAKRAPFAGANGGTDLSLDGFFFGLKNHDPL